MVVLGSMLHVATGVTAAAGPAANTEYVNVSATSSFSFVPSSFTVEPGATVHLAVTQLANGINHTFTLNSVRNATIPSGDSESQLYTYFHAHPPLVNLTLGTTAGKVFTKTFTAPAVGTYQFICIVHFADGMEGTMTVSTTPPSSSSTTPVSPLELGLGLGITAVVVAAVVVVVLVRRHPREPEPRGRSRRDRR